MIDKKGKLFGKISIIDLGIILMLIVFGLGIFLKFFVLDQTTTSTTNQTITFTLKIGSVRNLYYEQLLVGDSLYEATDKTKVGKIIDIYCEEAKTTYLDLDGRTKHTSAENRYDIYITIQGEGAVSEGRYLINRTYEVGLSSNKGYFTKYVAFNGLVKEISANGDQQ